MTDDYNRVTVVFNKDNDYVREKIMDTKRDITLSNACVTLLRYFVDQYTDEELRDMIQEQYDYYKKYPERKGAFGVGDISPDDLPQNQKNNADFDENSSETIKKP